MSLSAYWYPSDLELEVKVRTAQSRRPCNRRSRRWKPSGGLGFVSSSPLTASGTLIPVTDLCGPWHLRWEEYVCYLLLKHKVVNCVYLLCVPSHEDLKHHTSTSVSRLSVGAVQISKRQISTHHFRKLSHHHTRRQGKGAPEQAFRTSRLENQNCLNVWPGCLEMSN